MDTIQIIPGQEVNKEKWDLLALGKQQPSLGSVFTSYTYLNAVAERWYGLVVGDYAAVMPLIYKKKYGIPYLASLAFGRQLGLIGQQELALQQIVDKALDLFKYGDLIFNDGNQDVLFLNGSHPHHKGNGRLLTQPNLLLSLAVGYEKLWSEYAVVLRRKIKKARKVGLTFVMPGVTATDENGLLDRKSLVTMVITANRQFLREKMRTAYNLDPALDALEKLLMSDFGRQYFFPCAVIDRTGEIQMMDVYAIDHRRVYKMLSVLVNKGRELNAMAFGVDAFFQLYGGRPLVFDFMGSSIPSVRAWVEDFGAKEHPYFIYRYNALPWPVNLLKTV